MRPEQLTLVLRPRSGMEAVDLGIRLVQAHARSIFATSFAVILPPALLIIAVVGYALEMPSLAGTLIWWLKPLYDRALLHGLSHAVFGEQPGVRQTWRALPGLIRRSALLPALLWRRLDPLRSTRLPVDQLEGLKGRVARDRRHIVANRVGGAGFGLIAGLHRLGSRPATITPDGALTSGRAALAFLALAWLVAVTVRFVRQRRMQTK